MKIQSIPPCDWWLNFYMCSAGLQNCTKKVQFIVYKMNMTAFTYDTKNKILKNVG